MARVIRLLVYEGTSEWIDQTMERNAVQNTKRFGRYDMIKSVVLGSLPDEVTILVEELNNAD